MMLHAPTPDSLPPPHLGAAQAAVPTLKLYLVTRADLSPGQQAVQAAHALREWVEGFP